MNSYQYNAVREQSQSHVVANKYYLNIQQEKSKFTFFLILKT
jgi:hypothetical protein